MSEITSKPATDAYREGWDRIFGKPKDAAGPCALCPDCGAIVFAQSAHHEQDERSARTYGEAECPRCSRIMSWLIEMTAAWRPLTKHAIYEPHWLLALADKRLREKSPPVR